MKALVYVIAASGFMAFGCVSHQDTSYSLAHSNRAKTSATYRASVDHDKNSKPAEKNCRPAADNMNPTGGQVGDYAALNAAIVASPTGLSIRNKTNEEIQLQRFHQPTTPAGCTN